MNHVIQLATARFKLDINGTHGLPHWQRVAANGMQISQRIDVNLKVIQHFAYLHDACREDEDDDPYHGQSCAEWVYHLWEQRQLALNHGEFSMLEQAIRLHNAGQVSTNDTIGACWDADRLDLTRCHIAPAERFMSTCYAKNLTKEIYELL